MLSEEKRRAVVENQRPCTDTPEIYRAGNAGQAPSAADFALALN